MGLLRRLFWAAADEERALEKSFERLSDERREDAKRAKSTYVYGQRSANTAVGGVDLVVRVDAGEMTLSMRRCGYSKDEPVKEGSERTAMALLGRDVRTPFGATRVVARPAAEGE